MRFLLCCLLLTCPLLAKEGALRYRPPSAEELRVELEDVKHALKTVQVELNLIDERSKKPVTAALEKKIAQLEQTVDKALQDVRALHTELQEIAQKVAQQDKRLDDVVQLKSTLSALTKAIRQPQVSATGSLYHVKAGDSLEKIAKMHGISVELLKKLNQLKGDRIIIGQELKTKDE